MGYLAVGLSVYDVYPVSHLSLDISLDLAREYVVQHIGYEPRLEKYVYIDKSFPEFKVKGVVFSHSGNGTPVILGLSWLSFPDKEVCLSLISQGFCEPFLVKVLHSKWKAISFITDNLGKRTIFARSRNCKNMLFAKMYPAEREYPFDGAILRLT